MDGTPNYDVAIVGYGPVGATAANLLGRLGLSVVVIERDPDIYNRARAISIDEEVMRIWQSVGLAERLQQDMLPGRPVSFVGVNGEPFLQWVIAPQGSGHPPQQFIYQPAVDEVLREGVQRFRNVDVFLEHECLGVHPQGDGVELMLADLRTDTSTQLHASYVIAADGGSSPIRSQLGVGYQGKTYGQRWLIIDTKVIKEWDAHDRLRFHCNPSRPTVDCPTPLSHHRWEYPVRPGDDEQKMSSHEEIWKVLNDQGVTDENVEILRAVFYSHHVRFADRWRVGRIFLAGDSAHAMPPWIGQGMSAGVRDVANLCWKLAAVLRGQAPESLLDSYETERLPHVAEVTRRATMVGRLITEPRRWVTTIRDRAARGAARLPYSMYLVQKCLWIPDAHCADGFFAAGNPAVGWQLPQPWVVDTRGATARLDDVLGGQWTMLHTGALPAGARAWSDLGVPTIRIEGPEAAAPGEFIRDAGGTLVAWLKAKKAESVVVRPDGFVYAASGPGQPLPPPPSGFTGSSAPAPVTPIRREASA